jgi:GTP-binding protein Era
MEQSGRKMVFADIVPVSARTGANVDDLEKTILKYLPEQPPLYPADQVTDRGNRFLAAELVREQIFRSFQQEVPYATAVSIEKFKRAKGALHVEATIWVEKEGQKPPDWKRWPASQGRREPRAFGDAKTFRHEGSS